MRRNRDYKPSDIQFRHVREVLQLMSVLTRDSRFEDAANAAMEGGEAANMCEVLDRAEKRGELKGKREGRLDVLVCLQNIQHRRCLSTGIGDSNGSGETVHTVGH